jgi:hypothetical protein
MIYINTAPQSSANGPLFIDAPSRLLGGKQQWEKGGEKKRREASSGKKR